uniref:Cytochrome b561 domain-containing protein n=1 Tax=Oryza punctata TaxID=4537 RepID=A0A0E0K8I7_ORYPU
MGAVTMASYAAVLRPRASSTTPRGPRRPAGAARRRAALPATTRSPRAVAATPPPREREQEQPGDDDQTTTRLYSLAPFPLLLAALLPGAEPVRAVFEPFVELVKTWDLPGWLVHWGHPGNMAVVLFAMGGYGTYLGFRIKLSDDPEEKAKAKDLHPKILAGMFFFFAAGAIGGITALLTSDKPIFESPHAVTGIVGLALLTIQSILPALFEGNPALRNAHGLLGGGIMTLFLIHAAFGLQLGLSF